jgi:hypothetical protein
MALKMDSTHYELFVHFHKQIMQRSYWYNWSEINEIV